RGDGRRAHPRLLRDVLGRARPGTQRGGRRAGRLRGLLLLPQEAALHPDRPVPRTPPAVLTEPAGHGGARTAPLPRSPRHGRLRMFAPWSSPGSVTGSGLLEPVDGSGQGATGGARLWAVAR